MSFDVSAHLMKLPQKKKDKATGEWITKESDYLQVMWRLVWFRDEKPNWTIDSEQVLINDNKAIFRCRILDENGRIVSTGHGSETPNDFSDYIEKAETKAVGRALAMLGYGTQFAPELDEGDRIVDTPVEAPKTPQKQNKTSGNSTNNTTKQNEAAKNDSGASEKANKQQIAEVFKLANERKKEKPDFDIFKRLAEMAKEMRISSQYPYADKEKTIINWTVNDVIAIIEDLELPF